MVGQARDKGAIILKCGLASCPHSAAAAASAKIVPIFAQIWRVTGLHVSSNTWRQKIWPNLAVAN
jgi:uncharacterized protein YcgI (DUF1989 family)